MAKRNQKAKKPRSKCPKKYISHQEADTDTPETHVPIQKSKRIINSKLLDDIKLCAEVTTVSQEDDNNEKRPIQQQTIELSIELNCADMSRETVHRLEIKSCSYCNNFRLDRPFMWSGRTQENVCKQRYGCTRKRGIKISVKFLHQRSQLSSMTKKSMTNNNKKKGTDKISVTKLNRKYGQWCRYDQAKQVTKKLTDKLKKCEEKIDKVSKQCVIYKELLKSVVEKREINEIEKLKSAQEDTVKKLKHRQYYLKKIHDDLIENMSGGVLTFF